MSEFFSADRPRARRRGNALAGLVGGAAAPAAEPGLGGSPGAPPAEDENTDVTPEIGEVEAETRPAPAKGSKEIVSRPSRATAAPRPAVRAEPDTPSLEMPQVDEVPQQVNVYLLPQAIMLADEICRREGLYHADIAMNAVDWALEEEIVEALVQARQGGARPAKSTFPGRARKRPRQRRGVRRGVWPCQFSSAQIRVLEGLAETYKSSVSGLISVAVEAHLLGESPVT